MEKITKSKDLQPGEKPTKDTFATAQEKTNALTEIQRHQEKLAIARKAIAERQAANGVTKEKMPLASAKERMTHVKPGETVLVT